MDVSIQEFQFDKTLKENKNATKERLYNELLGEVKKLMISLQRGKKQFTAVINCLKQISVDEAEELVERLYNLNGELKNYIRVSYDTQALFDASVYRSDVPKDPRKTYRGLPLTKLCIILEAK